MTGLTSEDGTYGVRRADGGFARARTVVIATGARYRRLDVPRLEEFEGSGVHYAATELEALACRRHPVAIVGGGNSTGQAALFLTRHASLVRVFVRGDGLAEKMSRYLIDRIEREKSVEVFLPTEVRELIGDRELEAVVVEDNRTGEQRIFETNDLFVFISADPCVGWLAGSVELDGKGYVRTGRGDALPLETNLPGCSRSATCEAGRSSGSPRRWARAPWRYGWSTSTCRADGPALRRRALSTGSSAIRHARGGGGPHSWRSGDLLLTVVPQPNRSPDSALWSPEQAIWTPKESARAPPSHGPGSSTS